MLFDIGVIFLLILLNGFFAMSEMAVVSARKARLTIQAEGGNRGARMALALSHDPAKFLASIQIGITLIGILSGAYSGATLAGPLGDYFANTLGFAAFGKDAAIAIVVIVVTYLSLIVGELVPKQLALKYAEPIACAIALPMALLARLTRPIVYLLDQSNKGVLRLLGARQETENTVTQAEVKAVIAEGTHSGALEPEVREMLDRVMRLGNFEVSVTMTHRQDIVWLDVANTQDAVLKKIERTRHSHFLVCNGAAEPFIGLVNINDLVLQLGRGEAIDLRAIARKPMCLDRSVTLLEALEEFKQSTASLAVVIDEYGAVKGLVTLKDLLETIIGTLPEPAHREDYSGVEFEQGGWMLDGGLTILEVEDMLGTHGMTAEGDAISTLAGFILNHSAHIPQPGDHFEWKQFRFEVIGMQRNRVDKVLVRMLD